MVTTPYAAASSYHFEFTACSGVESNASYLLISDDEAPDLDKNYEDEPRRGTRAHLYVPDALHVDDVTAYIELRVQREGFVSSAYAAAAAIMVVLALFTVLAGDIVRNGSGAPAALLLIPGLLATIVSRAGGDILVIRMLQYARWALITAGAAAYAAAISLFLTHTGSGAHAQNRLIVLWGLLCGLSATSAAVLGIARKLPRPDRGRLESVVELVEDGIRRSTWWRDRVRLRGLIIELDPITSGAATALARRLDETCVGVSVRPRPWSLWSRVPRTRRPLSRPLRESFRRPRDLFTPPEPSLVRIAGHYCGRPLLGHETVVGSTDLRLRSLPIQPGPRNRKSPHTERGPAEALANTILALRDVVGPDFRISVYWLGAKPTDEHHVRWEAFAATCAAARLQPGLIYSLSVRDQQGGTEAAGAEGR